jgi:hypothetical protein
MSPRPPAEATGIGVVSGGRLQLNRSVAQDGPHSARWMQETTDQKVVCSNHAGCMSLMANGLQRENLPIRSSQKDRS